MGDFRLRVTDMIRRDKFDTLIATGGDTANELLQTIGVTSLELFGELSPGFPMGKITSDSELSWIALKAGGFGDNTALYQAAKSLLP